MKMLFIKDGFCKSTKGRTDSSSGCCDTSCKNKGYDPDLRSGGCPVFSGWNNVEAGKFSNGETIEFAGLRSFTKYTVSGRYAETATAYAGKTVELLTVYTLVQDPYTIDIAKIADKEYQDALRTDDGRTTVSYTEPVLTLTEDGRDYVITGKNKELVIKAGRATKITLDQAEVGAVAIIGNADGKTEIVRKGTVTIAGNVETDGGLVISGNGSLTVSGKISGKEEI